MANFPSVGRIHFFLIICINSNQWPLGLSSSHSLSSFHLIFFASVNFGTVRRTPRITLAAIQFFASEIQYTVLLLSNTGHSHVYSQQVSYIPILNVFNRGFNNVYYLRLSSIYRVSARAHLYWIADLKETKMGAKFSVDTKEIRRIKFPYCSFYALVHERSKYSEERMQKD